MSAALTRAEEGLAQSIEAALLCVNRFGEANRDVLEHQTVTDYIDDIADLIGDFKIDLERVIAERQKLEAELSKVRSDAAWADEAARQRAERWEHSTWK